MRFHNISLYPSEIHLMLVIKNDIDTNSTKISNQLGLTKGAVSQTIARLVKKGILVKTKDPYNKNELKLSLTAFGKEAYVECNKSLDRFTTAHEKYLSKLNPKQKELIFQFLQHMEQSINDIE